MGFFLVPFLVPTRGLYLRFTLAGYTRTTGGIMSISELLLTEFDEEMNKTRTTLERVPATRKILPRTPNQCRWANWPRTSRNLPASV